MKFRAAVLHEAGKPLAIEEVEVPSLAPQDVLVRVMATGLCHTDLELARGSLARPLPMIPGHEAAGIVDAVGSQVTRVKPGDHVICSWNPSCGHCFYCEEGLPILCEPIGQHQPRGLLTDGKPRIFLNGEPVGHFMMISSHAEYCVVPEAGAVPVTKEIPFDRACLIGCAVATGFAAATRIAPVTFGSSVLVVGCGAIGLNVIQSAALARPARIIAVDLDDAKLAQAKGFGATDTINPANDDALSAVRELTSGRGADFAYEAAGNEKAMQFTLEAARPGAHVVLLGKVPVNQQVSFRWSTLVGEKNIIRSSYGGARPHRDFPLLAQAYLDGALKLDELISQRIRLEQINDGYAAIEQGRAIRSVVVFDA
jgi:S-(hydroxymethyl)glutathione dehydrogenase/alcohol dehydrogenase